MSASPFFEKVGECLYRNPTSGTYFARVKVPGKEIKQTLETKNLLVARRKLQDFKAKLERTEPAAGRITLKELAAGTGSFIHAQMRPASPNGHASIRSGRGASGNGEVHLSIGGIPGRTLSNAYHVRRWTISSRPTLREGNGAANPPITTQGT
jgi:hypothetical protein